MRINRCFLLFFCACFAFSSVKCIDNSYEFSMKNIFSEIPLQGNTYTVAGAVDVIRPNNGLLIDNLWTNNETVIRTYFRISNAGDLQLSLKYSANVESKIRITCQEKRFEVTCPEGKDLIIPIGKIDWVDSGYIAVDFQGIEKKGSTFPQIQSLLIEGKAAEGTLYFVDNPDFYYWGRRGPSVHLKYIMAEGDAEWFYNEVTVPEGDDPVGSYFMVNGFGEGYFGMQVNSETERRILFSVWSPFATDNPEEIPADEEILLNGKGAGVVSQSFGGEGSGRQNFMKYMWKANITYKFLLRCRPDPFRQGYTEYTAYFCSPDDGWMLVASNSRPKITTYCTRLHSFLENFNTEAGYITRKVYFDNQWVYVVGKGWQEITQCRFSYDNTARQKQRMDYRGGVENDKFFLQNCGFINDFTEKDVLFTRSARNAVPDIKFEQLPSFSISND